MRLFTAIDLPAEVTESLAALLDRLRPAARLRWSPIENLHITTKFIGEWPDARLAEIKQALQPIASSPFEVAVRGLGWFPNPKHPRVFWAGVEGGEWLRALAHSTEAAVAKLGVPVEKREYSPHLTLARVGEPVPPEALHREIAAYQPADFGTFRAAAFHLYFSAAGRYTKLADFPL